MAVCRENRHTKKNMIHKAFTVTTMPVEDIGKISVKVIDFLDGRPSVLRLFVQSKIDNSYLYVDAPQINYSDDEPMTVEQAKEYVHNTKWEDRTNA